MTKYFTWKNFFLTALVLFFVYQCTPVFSHSFYDRWCCDDKDCAPYPAEKVIEEKGGWYLPEFNLHLPFEGIPNSDVYRVDGTKVMEPYDERYHLCELPKGHVRCFYPRAGGV